MLYLGMGIIFSSSSDLLRIFLRLLEESGELEELEDGDLSLDLFLFLSLSFLLDFFFRLSSSDPIVSILD